MNWTITMHKLFTDEEHTIPFECGQVVYYAHKKRQWKKNSKWVLTKSTIVGVWATYAYGVTLENGTEICCVNFDELFTEREKAIEFCIKKNTHAKVKIYGE